MVSRTTKYPMPAGCAPNASSGAPTTSAWVQLMRLPGRPAQTSARQALPTSRTAWVRSVKAPPASLPHRWSSAGWSSPVAGCWTRMCARHRQAWFAPTMQSAANKSGPGILAVPIALPLPRQMKPIRSAHPTHGRRFPPTTSWGWSTSPLVMLQVTSMAVPAPNRKTRSALRWWPWMPSPARSNGTSRPSITTSGTTT
ncbi:hypothetical protein D9M73_136760 [compost metagenome]